MQPVKLFGLIMLGLLLSACSSNPKTSSDRYHLDQDRPPARTLDPDTLKDAVPHYEPYSRGGNKDYQVWGKSYKVWRGITQYDQEGVASWYGVKFHGYHTSNGELYDMYAMSAAHKHLPLPSYVKVTNLSNGRQVIVRVNDRGPFHDDRLIDLSYAAAAKLEMLKTGTAPVRVELLHFSAPTKLPGRLAETNAPPANAVNTTAKTKQPEATQDSASQAEQPPIATLDKTAKAESSEKIPSSGKEGKMIQLVATSSESRAHSLAERLKSEQLPVKVVHQGKLYKVQTGPYSNPKRLYQTLTEVQREFIHAFVVQ
ncbi:septal ring lytic transglycosylase RlpA family protein [Dongshaea marina]|uniref:septal ring lytic transglycosylase RlpA family protein n=1 Tax=Dongshaea marina TaxID=2047966 RepID=UPI000D3E103F|nr:septal ring lytic transglycosylase RlpA family protein [Dongshaea marina]